MTKKRVEQYGVTQMFGKVLVPTDFSEYAKNHFMPHNDPRDTGSRPPAWCRSPPAHQAHIENAWIQLDEEKNSLNIWNL